MAFIGYGKIAPAANMPKDSYGTNPKAIKGDVNQGQIDSLAGPEPKNHKSGDGWFRVLHWDYQARRSTDIGQQAKGGKVNKSTLRIIKYFGRLSPLILLGMANNNYFDFTLDVMERAGDDASLFMQLAFTNCQFIRVHHFVGDGNSSSATALGSERQDTLELEEFEFVYGALAESCKVGMKSGTLDFNQTT
jgi:type VI protein secretion system component Hcp